MLQKYQITEQLSKHLYKAQRKLDNKQTIIKQIPFSSVSPKSKQHIVNQVNNLVRLQYVHLLRYYDYEINKKTITVDIAMEYCQGGTIQDLINKHKQQNRKIAQEDVWRIFYQLVQALDYIHKDSVVHRNISPANIFFKEQQRKNIKLGGFRLSKKLDFQEQFAQTILPNTYYLSPQQIQTGRYAKQADVWALGCLIYQICALQPPFKSFNQNEFERAKQIKQFKPKKVAYSIELNRVIFGCLQKRPENRLTIADLLGTPEINIRIRERRLKQKQNELMSKQQKLAQRQSQLLQKQQWIRQQKIKGYQSLKKKSSQLQASRTFNMRQIANNKLILY